MATFAETIEYKLEVLPNKTIQCRRADIVLKDGVEVARSYQRMAHAPGSDVSAACQEVQDVAGALWTQEVIDAYEASLPAPLSGE